MGKVNEEFITDSGTSIKLIGVDEKPEPTLYNEYYKIARKRGKGIKLTEEEEKIIDKLVNKNIPKLLIKKGNTETEIDIKPTEMLYFADFIQNIVNTLYNSGQKSFEQIINTHNISNSISPKDRKDIEEELDELEKQDK